MTLYEDPDFSLEFTNPPCVSEIVWRRPKDIVRFPKFFDVSYCPVTQTPEQHFERRKDIKARTSVFFSIAVASLTKKIRHFMRVVPEQSFQNNYTGNFRFKFFEENRVTVVEIDDRLPTSVTAQLLFSDCVNDVFWYPLLEQAYAKFRGGYDAISTGLPVEAFYHLTGEWPICIDNEDGCKLAYSASGMYNMIENLVLKKSLIVCKQNNIPGNNEEHGTGFVVIGTQIKKLRSNNGCMEDRRFIRVRHPSGSIDCKLKNQMSIFEISNEKGEGLIAVERFLDQIQCVYFLDLIDTLQRNQGIDPFYPLILDNSSQQTHRCKKH